MYLSDYKGVSHNLQLTRFLLAILVIFNHSFALSTGNASEEWLVLITNGQMTFGGFAVSLFFLCGGYYAARTVIVKQDNRYLLHRLIRLIPELAIVIVSCVMIGAIISNCSFREYFEDIRTWRYLLNAVMVLQHDLPGVFEGNVYAQTVNGALWTLPVEFICNIGCFVANKCMLLKRNTILISTLIILVLEYGIWWLGFRYDILRSVIIPSIMFFVGILYFLFSEHIKMVWWLAVLAVSAFCFLTVLGCMKVGMVVFLPYALFCLWFSDRQIPQALGRTGDYSYALYLWGFPVQQTVVSMYGGSMIPYVNFLISLPIALFLALITHRLTCVVRGRWQYA